MDHERPQTFEAPDSVIVPLGPFRRLAVATCVAVFLGTGIALGAEPTLNDLPMILQKLRGCSEVRGVFGNTSTCSVDGKDLWVAIEGDGKLTLFRQRSYGDMIYAHGDNVTELLRNFAASLNKDRDRDKMMLDALSPLLPTQ